MYERFTDRARKVMQLANQEAQNFNHEYIGTEHLLFGLIKEGSGVAANVLMNLDVDLRKIRLEVEKLIQGGPEIVSLGKLPQTPTLKKVIEYSMDEARSLGHNYIGTEHILLGMLREQESVAGYVLMNLGLKLENVREEVLNLVGYRAIRGAGRADQSPASPSSHVPLSAIHRALWEHEYLADSFSSSAIEIPAELARVMNASLEVVQRHRAANTIFNGERKLNDAVIAELATVGYWGMLTPPEFGGCGGSLSAVLSFLTRVATFDPTVAGLFSVHSCIGPVNMLVHFGSPEQQGRLLPPLARGERLGAFGLTEPNAGSDLTALRTTAVMDGDDYVVHGEKLFITNLLPGRTLGLVCKIEEVPAVMIVELPAVETPEFHLVRYGLHSLQHTHNHGCVFRGLRVPTANRLLPPRGDGLQIAYHGLNRGRAALCANAAGTLRVMLANMLPWVRFRQTHGAAIGTRELVLRRLGRMAELIFGCDALAAWAAGVLDRGGRGEMEAIVAKTFAADALHEAAVELCLKTHGGRAFLVGHPLGDQLHDYLAPSIYEGENEVLLLAFFKALVKPRIMRLIEPSPGESESTQPSFLKSLLKPLFGRFFEQPEGSFPTTVTSANDETALALADQFVRFARQIELAMQSEQAGVANQQLLMAALARDVARVTVAAVVHHTVVPTALDRTALSQGLIAEAVAMNDQEPAANSHHADLPRQLHQCRLGERILAGEWPELEALATTPIMQTYPQEN